MGLPRKRCGDCFCYEKNVHSFKGKNGKGIYYGHCLFKDEPVHYNYSGVDCSGFTDEKEAVKIIVDYKNNCEKKDDLKYD